MISEQEAYKKYHQLLDQLKRELKPAVAPLQIVKGVVNECKQITSLYNHSFKITLDNGEVFYYNGLTALVAPKLFPKGKFVAFSCKISGRYRIIETVYETFQ
jgi:hypothetical protein